MYYGIFYLLIFFWPLLAIKAMYGDTITQDIKNEVLKWYTVIVLSSVIFHNPLNFHSFFLEPGVSQKQTFQRLQTSILYNLPELGHVLVDGEVASLAPATFKKDQILYLRNVPVAERRKFFGFLDPKIQEQATADSVMFYNYYKNDGLLPFYILLSHLPNLYQVVGTRVYLASNKKLSELPSFSPILVPLTYEQEKGLKQDYLSSTFKEAHYKKSIKHIGNDFEIPAQGASGMVIYSKPLRLPKGQYCVQFGLTASAPVDPQKPILAVDIASQDTVFALKEIFYKDLELEPGKELQFCFTINENLPHAHLSVRFWKPQDMTLTIKDPKIK
jgi:hypothetical protein